MLVLLPPSEGKTAPTDGAPVALSALVHPELTLQREQLLAALARLVSGPPTKALAALALTVNQVDELDRDRDLIAAPAARAADVYTGVLFRHLDLAGLPPGARANADERVLVASALWGVVRLTDRIPAYRLSMGAKLPQVGPLPAFWRPALGAVLPPDGLLVDLRSQSYAAAWRPPRATVVEIRAFTQKAGRRTVVSHMAKATRGDVAALLCRVRTPPKEAAGVAAVVERGGHVVELREPTRPGGAWSVDVITAG